MKRIKLFTAALLLGGYIRRKRCVGAFRFKKERHASGKITPILQWKRQPAASTSFNSDSLQTVSTKIDTDKDGIHDLYFVFKGKELKVDEWMFERF